MLKLGLLSLRDMPESNSGFLDKYISALRKTLRSTATRDLAISVILYETGMPAEWLLRVDYNDVDEENWLLTMRDNDSDSRVYTLRVSVSHVRDWLNAHPTKIGFLFPGSGDNHLKVDSLNRNLKRVFEKMEFDTKDIGPIRSLHAQGRLDRDRRAKMPLIDCPMCKTRNAKKTRLCTLCGFILDDEKRERIRKDYQELQNADTSYWRLNKIFLVTVRKNMELLSRYMEFSLHMESMKGLINDLFKELNINDPRVTSHLQTMFSISEEIQDPHPLMRTMEHFLDVLDPNPLSIFEQTTISEREKEVLIESLEEEWESTCVYWTEFAKKYEEGMLASSQSEAGPSE